LFSGDNITVMAWANSEAATGVYRGILAERFNGDGDVQFILHLGDDSEDGLFTVGFYDGAWNQIRDTNVIETNRWYHVVGTYDGHFLRLYKDGSLVSISSDLDKGLPAGGDGWYIGKRHDEGGSNHHWTGLLDEVAIFNRSLSDSEIDGIFNSNSGQAPPTTTTTTTTTTLPLNITVAPLVYPKIATEANTFQSQTPLSDQNINSLFNTLIGNSFVVGSDPIGSPKFIPLVADLDSDGQNEIVTLGGTTVRLHRFVGNDLVQVGSRSFINLTTEPYMTLFDIDGDNLTEIIFASQSGEINIVEWDGVSLTRQNSFTLDGLDIQEFVSGEGEIMIECRDVEDCMVIYTNRDNAQEGTDFKNTTINARSLTSTSLGSRFIVEKFSGDENLNCFPSVPNLVNADVNGVGGAIEWIFSVIHADDVGEAQFVKVYYLDKVGDSITKNHEVNATIVTYISSNFVIGQKADCHTGTDATSPFQNTTSNISFVTLDELATSPLLLDVASDGGGLDTIIGVQEFDDAFRMHLFNPDGSIPDPSIFPRDANVPFFPKIFSGEGNILGNPFKANAIRDTGENDFCVMGWRQNERTLDVVCANPKSDEALFTIFGFDFAPIKTREFFANLSASTLGNPSQLEMITHSIQSSGSTFATTASSGATINPNEILTPFGVFSLNYNNALGFRTAFNLALPIFELKPEFPNPTIKQGIMIPVNFQGTNFDDLLLYTDTNLIYIEDLFVNQPPSFTCTINPCLDQLAISLNETVLISVTPDDPENNNVRMKVISYVNTPNEVDTNFTEFFIDGTTLPQSFIANLTTTSALMSIIVSDDKSEFESGLNFSYAVAENGLRQGDCIQSCTFVSVPVGVPPEVTTTTTIPVTELNVDDNAVINAINELAGLTGVGTQIFWLIFMTVAGLSIFVAGVTRPNVNLGMCFGVFLVIETLLLVIGFLLGFFGFGTLLTIVVIAIAILGIMFARFFTGTDT
ncbi:MAG: LamG domain-containing protein, partial [Bacteroidetes bacterium]|nr:LamG domain-containing protein [Bacteroidota bacterium]